MELPQNTKISRSIIEKNDNIAALELSKKCSSLLTLKLRVFFIFDKNMFSENVWMAGDIDEKNAMISFL